ncbi:MAG: LysM peptidoglycan-binding domain-containing protein [Desulfatiglandales bacterium]
MKKHTILGNIAGIIAFLSIVWMSGGCVAPEKASHPVAAPADQVGPGVIQEPGQVPGTGPEYYLHTVKWPGESVSIIAKWYTGALENWRLLAEANPGINPNRIFVGDKIRIPVHLMKTREPITEEFLSQFYPGQQEEEDEPTLFGPKTGN